MPAPERPRITRVILQSNAIAFRWRPITGVTQYSLRYRERGTTAWNTRAGYRAVLDLPASAFFGGGSWTLEPANADRPKLPESSLIPAGEERWLAQLRIWPTQAKIDANEQVELAFVGAQNDAFTTRADLVRLFEDYGVVHVEVERNGEDATARLGGRDVVEPYVFTPANVGLQNELRAISDSMRMNRGDGWSATTITLTIQEDEAVRDGYDLGVQPPAAAADTYYVLEGDDITNDTEYEFQLRASNNDGDSAWSDAQIATPRAATPFRGLWSITDRAEWLDGEPWDGEAWRQRVGQNLQHLRNQAESTEHAGTYVGQKLLAENGEPLP